MSRIGKKPIIITDKDVQVLCGDGKISFSGPKGKAELTIPKSIQVKQNDSQIDVLLSDPKDSNIHGLFRSEISNAIHGVKSGWNKTLELVGVGYRAETSGSQLTVHVGFSHPVKIDAPAGVTFQVNENKITVNGVNKYMVGEIAARIRRIKPPEPYKGKGIRYEGEFIRKKLGKAAKAVGGATAK